MKPSTGKISSKGQLIIPVELRRQYQLQTGTRVRFERHKDGIFVRPLTKSMIRQLRGILSGDNWPDKIERDADRELR
jgi:AbrB family looped-hinge helix DNA binding protein